MRLKSGDRAPDFASNDIFGKRFELSALRGKHVLLAFHRFSSCPFCNFRVHQLRTRFRNYSSQGLNVVTVFESSEANLREGVAKQDVPFPIISNPDLSLYRTYGVENSRLGVLKTMIHAASTAKEAKKLGLVQPIEKEGDITRMPADFLIDPQGRIQTAYYGNHMSDHVDFQVIDAFLANRS